MLIPLSLLTFACGSASVTEENVGSEDAGPTTQIVIPSDRMFAISDFENAGLKHSKDYKTEDCLDATGFHYSFGRWPVHRSSSKFGSIPRTMKPLGRACRMPLREQVLKR